jgi:ribosomal protein L12E/L44/L45/RPP1/RPP2
LSNFEKRNFDSLIYKRRARAPATKPAPATPALTAAAPDLGVEEGAAEADADVEAGAEEEGAAEELGALNV